MTFEKILSAALALPEAERVELVDRLLETIPHADDDEELLDELEQEEASDEDDLATSLVKNAERAGER
jgi:hypothetical protein